MGEGEMKEGKLALRRGLFRLWLVAAACFVRAVAIDQYQDIRQDFQAAAFDREVADSSIPLVPIECGQARGTPSWRGQVAPENKFRCWYELPAFRKLYPEYKDLTDKALSDHLYRAAGYPIHRAAPWARVVDALSIGLGVPAAVLVLGAALLWVIAGFTANEVRGER
jgi:hypothetical protein